MSYRNIENSKGMSEKELLDLCSDENNHPYFRGAPYWTAEIYSFGRYIREYGYYPRFLPLAIYTDHGPQRIPSKPYKHELESDAPVMFYHSPESVKIWQRFSKKRCYVLYSPFVFYRKKSNIKKNENAKGTIAFPIHSTSDIDVLFDIDDYIRQLKELPERFQPVSVCLHIHDIKKGLYKIFMENGIPVYTAGGNSEYFAERFYDILRSFSFATSNMVSSSLFYAIEMDVPFFIYGDKPYFFNKGNEHYMMGKYDFYAGNDFFQRVHEFFLGVRSEITKEQKMLVESELGLYDGISRKKMAAILYFSLIEWMFSSGFLRWLVFISKKIIKYYKLKK